MRTSRRSTAASHFRPALRAYDLETVRRMGVEAAAKAAVAHVSRKELEGFFIHVDADCLDDAIMPAVDYRLEGGLSWNELRTVLQMALASGRCRGLEVTIYNPSLDTDGSAGRGLADVLATALGTSAPAGQHHKPPLMLGISTTYSVRTVGVSNHARNSHWLKGRR